MHSLHREDDYNEATQYMKVSVDCGCIELDPVKSDAKLAEIYGLRATHGAAHPGHFNAATVCVLLEDKLTGCDPQSLLSVPANVETFRNLLNGLTLMPMTSEEINLLTY